MSHSADSDGTRLKWDARYRDSHSSAAHSAEVLRENQQLLPESGKALDLAAGLGANARFLAAKGLEVHAWDISEVALERLTHAAQQQGLRLHTQCRDVIARPPEPESFDLIVVSRFLERELCPAIAAALRPGGLLFYQTYSRENRGREGPSNPRFLLREGELPELFAGLEVLYYREGAEAQLVARRAEE